MHYLWVYKLHFSLIFSLKINLRYYLYIQKLFYYNIFYFQYLVSAKYILSHRTFHVNILMAKHLKRALFPFFIGRNKIRMIIYKKHMYKSTEVNQRYAIRSLYNYFIVLLFENFGYTTWNESFEFLLEKCQRVIGLWEWE